MLALGTKIQNNKLNCLQIILYAFTAALILSPLTSNITVPANLDYLAHLSAIIQAKLALSEGQFPLRVAPTDHQGMVYPLFQFYSTTTYTFAGAVYKWLSPNNPFIAYKLTIWFVMLIGAIYLNRIAFYFFQSRLAAFFAGIVYITAPYTLITINHIGAFNEAVAIGVLPAVLFYSIQRYEVGQDKTLITAAVMWYLLATIHLITFIATSLTIAAFFILISLHTNNASKKLLRLGLAYLFGCLLAFWYLAPIYVFGHYLVANRTFNDAASFYAYTPNIFNLLSPLGKIINGGITNEGFINPISRTKPNIGLPMTLAFMFSIYLFLYQKLVFKNKWFLALLILSICIFAIICSPINFWQWLPKPFLVFQYSWRLLSQFIWIGALLFAGCISWVVSYQKHYIRQLLVITCVSIASTSVWLFNTVDQPIKFIDELSKFISSDFYLLDINDHPQFISLVDNQINGNDKNILNLKSTNPFCKRVSTDIVCDLEITKNILFIELPIFFYPQLLQVTINDQFVDYFSIYNGKNMLLGLIPEVGKRNHIVASFRGFDYANYVSMCSWFMWLIFLIYIGLQNLIYKKRGCCEDSSN